jgi:SAM-dependent methyltransferase
VSKIDGLPDYAQKNRAHWNRQAPEWVAMGERAWTGEPSWGVWGIPESDLRLLPNDMTGMDSIELGCGTGYFSAWLARRGARAVGIDVSEKQLETAQRLAGQHGVPIDFIHGNAEAVPYPDGSFDFALSEYGAAIWADPYVWIPEAWRLLRPGGTLVFLGNHPLMTLCQLADSDEPVTRELLYPYFGMHRIDWHEDDDEGTVFNLPISEWFALFHKTGFEIVSYHELRSPERGSEVRSYVTPDWANDYPTEQIWKLRKPL